MMTKSEGEALRDEIVQLATSKGQWVVVSEELKPDMKKIKLEVSIKIDK